MKKLFPLLAILLITTAMTAQNTFYDFTVKDINGKDFDFSQLKGKKVMVVNTASKCGFTKQYKGLQELYEKYKDQDFTIIGFPANNFMNQEPGTNEEIKKFCSTNYGVTFPMMSKISVKGDDIHPVYQWLTQKSKNGEIDSKVKWNFQKYLINPDGTLHNVIGTRTKPMNDKIINWIEGK
ncbi:MAG: glutathione peroxidase [Bacteroidales bacterium]|nr:glutathione peroxidase [Bacteroidales bacterium]